MNENNDVNIKKQNQIFKKEVPINIIWDFMQKNFEDKGTYFLISKFSYKKIDYNKTLSTFTELLKEYYYNSKKKYIERTMNYNYFLTIIRQLCNAHNIKYSSKLVYDKSSYEIEYYICKE